MNNHKNLHYLHRIYYANESKKYYEWAITEINMYIQNNSKMISTTMAAQASQQQRA